MIITYKYHLTAIEIKNIKYIIKNIKELPLEFKINRKSYKVERSKDQIKLTQYCYNNLENTKGIIITDLKNEKIKYHDLNKGAY